MKFAFIDQHREQYPVRLMCKVLEVSHSGYYAWRIRPVSQREMANQKLTQEIKTVFEASRKTYGSPRIYQRLKSRGFACSENRVARLMRLAGLQAKQSKRYRSTTRRHPTRPVAPNRLGRDFSAEAPNKKWGTDITYIKTAEGWLYLAVVLDLFARLVVGWAMSKRMTGELTQAALKMAIQRREPAKGLLHHSDQGSQYTDKAYQALLEEYEMTPSMNGVGTWYDNAAVESFFGSLKSELVNDEDYQTRREARTSIFWYIEVFYNRERLHSTLGYLTPADFEAQYQKLQARIGDEPRVH
jgi:transposase InsO family protein